MEEGEIKEVLIIKEDRTPNLPDLHNICVEATIEMELRKDTK
jgi:hypothetical protein